MQTLGYALARRGFARCVVSVFRTRASPVTAASSAVSAIPPPTPTPVIAEKTMPTRRDAGPARRPETCLAQVEEARAEATRVPGARVETLAGYWAESRRVPVVGSAAPMRQLMVRSPIAQPPAVGV